MYVIHINKERIFNMTVYCKDCLHIVKPIGAVYEPHPDSICATTELINYVTSKPRHESCKYKNANGMCKDYKQKDDGEGGVKSSGP
jgi:hypothetical protein